MRILYVTTISLTMNSFFKPHIEMLVKEGHQVDIACNDKDLPLDSLYEELGCQFHTIDFSRSPLSFDNIKAYGQLKKVVENGNYDIVHCHTPIAAMCTRTACNGLRKEGVRVIYTAHGFHFYKGAPLLNWLIYYPIEKICSFWTDVLITINQEDYELAKRKMKARKIEYVPGVGIDVNKFKNTVVNRTKKRKELGIPEDAFLVISVGELNRNKNHEVVIRALAELKDENIHYAIVGVGVLEKHLLDLSSQLDVLNNLHLLGYRKDVAEIYKIADICCFPSIREGLPVAVMEAMACGIPIICSKIRGNEDLIDEKGGVLVDCVNVSAYVQAIKRMRNDFEFRNSTKDYSSRRIKDFSEEKVFAEILELYEV